MSEFNSAPPPIPSSTTAPPPPLAAGPVGYASPEPGFRYAGFGLRLVAWIVDGFVMGVAQVVLLLILGVFANVVDEPETLKAPPAPPTSEWREYVALGVLFGGPLLVGWLYFAIFEASRAQATLGKLAAGVRVQDIDGGRATFVQTSVRFFVKLVSFAIMGFGFLMILFTKRQQALHDIGANTIVTRRPPAPFAPAAAR
jgi:uncharacterized RDD family membrane protein YckC